MVDIRQSTLFAKYLTQIGWKAERHAEINYFVKKIPLVGAIVKIQRPEEIRIKKIMELAKRYRAFQIIVEPKKMADGQWLMANGFKLSKSPYLPTKTLQLDLTKSSKSTLLGFKKDCRQAIGKNKDLRFKIYDLSELENFRKAWKRAVGLKRYVPPLTHLKTLKKSFGKNCLFISTGLPAEASAEAGAIFLLADKTAYYWQAFTSGVGRKNQYQYKIVWDGILWAKKNKAKIFDFEGIYDERFPNKSWLGFTHFKKSFGGYEIEYPGCYTRFRFLI